MRGAFSANGGEEVDNQGDGFFVAFRVRGTRWWRRLRSSGRSPTTSGRTAPTVLVRVGIHSGEARRRPSGTWGSRSIAQPGSARARHGGQVLLSSTGARRSSRTTCRKGCGPPRSRPLAAEGHRPTRADLATRRGGTGGRDFPPLRGVVRVGRAAGALRRRSLLVAALVGVIAAAIAIPVFALSGGRARVARLRRRQSVRTASARFDASNGRGPIASSPVGGRHRALLVAGSKLPCGSRTPTAAA